uniref:STI1 domain-containing protein n=1 Tax=Tetradesmus obliquus TaxID=3088 RepID=A0A383WN26_TETOB
MMTAAESLWRNPKLTEQLAANPMKRPEFVNGPKLLQEMTEDMESRMPKEPAPHIKKRLEELRAGCMALIGNCFV